LDVDRTLLDFRECSDRTGMKLVEAAGDAIYTYA
jgi:hypothetical protein